MILNSNNLGGQVPNELSVLDSLDTIYLYSNRLEGSIPSAIYASPNIQIID